MGFLLSPVSLPRSAERRAFPRAGFSSRSASTAGASPSWAPAALRLFRVEVVSATFYPSQGTIDVTPSVCASVLCLVTTTIWSDGH